MVAISIGCTHCGKSGSFDIELEFSAKREDCKSCGHEIQRGWTYYFCTLKCFSVWMKEKSVPKNGFPCQSCMVMAEGEPTGFAGAIKENGPCKTCGGKKSVRNR